MRKSRFVFMFVFLCTLLPLSGCVGEGSPVEIEPTSALATPSPTREPVVTAARTVSPTITATPTAVPCIPTTTPTPCLTATASPGYHEPDPCALPINTDPFSATLSIEPANTQLKVGDIVSVTIDLAVVDGCQYAIYELQASQTTPLLTPADLLEVAPISLPTTITMTAVLAGDANVKLMTLKKKKKKIKIEFYIIVLQCRVPFIY